MKLGGSFIRFIFDTIITIISRRRRRTITDTTINTVEIFIVFIVGFTVMNTIIMFI